MKFRKIDVLTYICYVQDNSNRFFERRFSKQMKKEKVLVINNTAVKVEVVSKHSPKRNQYLSENDKEMDRRASAAVDLAIKKAKNCGAPIGRYDKQLKKAYLEYADGRREYV